MPKDAQEGVAGPPDRGCPRRELVLKVLRGVTLGIHPFPTTANATAGALFLWIADVDAVATSLDSLILFGSIFLTHSSIGMSNDYCDLPLDRLTSPRKPLVRGDISPRTAVVVACTAAFVAALLSLPLGWKVLLVCLTVLASGMLYNLWARGTIYSWIPHAVAIPAIPIWSFVAADQFRPIVLLSFPVGALISLALHLANTLPDLTGDLRVGVKGLAHRLGRRRSIATVWCSFAGALGLLAATPSLVGNNSRPLFPGVIIGSIILLFMIIGYATNHSDESLRRGWYLSAILAIVLGGAWVASLSAS
jgi:geranylgeranylglycerol-phosphate geranylgeranyltransferase